MDDTDLQPRAALSPGHIFFAIVLAAAVAGAGCTWLIFQGRRSASTAVLAFHPAAAQQIDPGLASAKEPAIALANSLLDDRAVASLARQAHLASATTAGQIGEFRARLELTEPSPDRLGIRFQSAGSAQSIAVANAVAHILAGSTPAASNSAGASPAPVSTQAPASQPSTSKKTPVSTAQNQSNARPSQPAPAAAPSSTSAQPLSDALDQLAAGLSSTDRQLDRLAATGDQDPEQASYVQSKQQSLLRTQVRAAEKQLSDLRAQFPRQASDPAIRGRLGEIQQALASILSAGRNGFNEAGTSTRQLQNEQSDLRQAIGIVQRESPAIRRIEAAQAASPRPASPGQDPPKAPPADPPAATPPAPAQNSSTEAQKSSMQEENLPPTGAASPSPAAGSPTAFTVEHLAVPAQRPPLWPGIAAGLLCGILYLGIAAVARREPGNRRSRYEDDAPEEASTPARFITPAGPVSNGPIPPKEASPTPPQRTVEAPRVQAESRAAEPEPPRIEPEPSPVPAERAQVLPETPRSEPDRTGAEPERSRVEPDRTEIDAERTGIVAERKEAMAERTEAVAERSPARSEPPRFVTDPNPVQMERARLEPEPPRIETRQRASFAFEPPPAPVKPDPAPTSAAPSPAAAPPSAQTERAVPPPPPLQETGSAAPAGTNQPPAAPEQSAAEPPPNRPPVDPVTERIRMSIAETAIGRLLEGLEPKGGPRRG